MLRPAESELRSDGWRSPEEQKRVYIFQGQFCRLFMKMGDTFAITPYF